MFQDPLITVMAMLLLCFIGIMVMFLFFVRALNSQTNDIREAFRKQQMSLADIERQLMDMSFALRKNQEESDSTVASSSRPMPQTFPALSSQSVSSKSDSGNLTSMRQEDLMAMLEAASLQKSASGRPGDQLLSPSSVSLPVTDAYDPIEDPRVFEDSLLPEDTYSTYRSRAAARSGHSGKRQSSLALHSEE